MTPDYAAVLTATYPDALWGLNDNDLATLTWDSDGEPPSQAELDAAWPDVDYQRQYAQVEAQRRARYQVESDGLFFAAQRDGGDLVAWEAAVAGIKADLPYPDAP